MRLAPQDPREVRRGLEDAFTPTPGGMELSEKGEDLLSTTPEEMGAVVDAVLGAFDVRVASSMLGEAAGLMDPKVVGRLRDIQKMLRKDFL